jgi:hypothetical protein
MILLCPIPVSFKNMEEVVKFMEKWSYYRFVIKKWEFTDTSIEYQLSFVVS